MVVYLFALAVLAVYRRLRSNAMSREPMIMVLKHWNPLVGGGEVVGLVQGGRGRPV